MSQESHIALLIDADNCPAAKIEEILDELAKYGVINIRRAYGNWKSPGLKSWEAVLHEYAIQPMQQFAYTKGKNATDSAMIIDAMDLLYSQNLDGFCLASSDSDFTPLVMRIRANGLKVFGFGEKKTPSPFVNACSKFLYLENLGATDADTPASEVPPAAVPSARAEPDGGAGRGAAAGDAGKAAESSTRPVARPTPRELRGDARLVNLLRKSVEAAADDEGWAALGEVGQHISKQASFDSRNVGYARLRDLMQDIGLFDVSQRDKAIYVRDKRLARKPAP
ncbi:NYN domain-containing protein [Zoogloea sp.]|uniref:NYN domain-containing protein n=1 Tax=Zoogloea sp. TaxID=49181 RepID=UPI002B84F1A0|nr:NYN domain-containing protein [Zoogloea sp.]HNB63069.1 NYN domain-containing protein [Rhodocyclaceae bacterium]HNC80137.1 NYN domain-containing protein [Rhodocyclaceae bacterium]HNH14873.1 NYN domain-containing protein [Zoogloea sp.]